MCIATKDPVGNDLDNGDVRKVEWNICVSANRAHDMTV